MFWLRKTSIPYSLRGKTRREVKAEREKEKE
jgi:hypothetical protein